MDVRVPSHHQIRVRTLCPDLSNQLRHQHTSRLITPSQEAGNVSRVLDALDSNVGGAAHHLTDGGDEGRARDCAHIAGLGGAAGEENSYSLAGSA